MTAPTAQTQTEIRKMLKRAGVHPNRRRGQCFLIDGNLMGAIVEAAELSPDDLVLEVGTGTASLTRLIAERAGEVLTVEVDAGLARIARKVLAETANVTLFHADVLAGKHAINPEVIDALNASAERHARMKLVANLPYSVATPLLLNLIFGDLAFERMVFTVQEEVAARLTASPGTRDYGWVSVVMATAGETRIVRPFPASVFWPPPNVASALIEFRPRAGWKREVDLERLRRFGPFVFQQRRKTIGRVVRNFLAERADAATAAALLDEVKIAAGTRGDRLTPGEIVRLSERIV